MDGKITWGDGTPWQTSTAYYTWLRGALRRVWSKHPVKLELLKSVRRKVPNPAGRKGEVFACDCAVCGGVFRMADCQVDHRIPAGSLTCEEDIAGFVVRLLHVTTDELRVVCKQCNATLAYAEKQGISFELAFATKEAIAIQKSKQDSVWLREVGIVPASSAPKRKEQIIQYIMKEETCHS